MVAERRQVDSLRLDAACCNNAPFYYDLFHGDVGHTLVLGATGAGKSFTLNFLLVQALQYHQRILILDLGGSYRKTRQQRKCWAAYNAALVRRSDVMLWLSSEAIAAWTPGRSRRRGGQRSYFSP